VTYINEIGWILAALALGAAVRWCWRRAPLMGAVILLGALARVIAGVALFWISLRHLPILPKLQLGNGFWVLALDGVSYYDAARIAAEQGLATISGASASPAYVRLLALALRAFGETPLTAVLLNVAAFIASSAICLAMWPPRPAGAAWIARAIAIGALAFSPSLLLASTQPLKDQVFALGIVATLACLRLTLTAMMAAGPGVPGGALARGALGVAGAAAAVYVLAGIRAYYAVLVVLSAALVMIVMVALLPLRRWPVQLAAAAVAATVLWSAFTYGAGPYAVPYRRFVYAVLRIPFPDSTMEAAVAPIEQAREGFLGAGGGTNIFRRHRPGANRMLERITNEAIGIGALFVPISLLRGLSIVDITGGRGLLAITDIETLFLDVTIALQLWVVLRQRRGDRGGVAFLILTVTLATVVMLPLAYVVTNYGTMFRMRLMYAIPLWLSGAALVGSEALAPAGVKAVRRGRRPGRATA
jgi:hypothetical protein